MRQRLWEASGERAVPQARRAEASLLLSLLSSLAKPAAIMSAEKSAKTVTQVLEGSRNKVEFDLRQIFDLAEIEKEGKKSLQGVR